MALEALKSEATMSELASRFDVYSRMKNQWKRALLGASAVFERARRKAPLLDEDQISDLHAKIGVLAVANFFWKESSGPEAGSVARHD